MRAFEEDARLGWNAAHQSQHQRGDTLNENEEESVLEFWKRAIGVRKAHDVLVGPVPAFVLWRLHANY